MSLKKILCHIVPLLLFPAALHADFFNNRNVLLGERAALMGGAYTALSEDVSGAFYNPAGLAFMDSSALSLNASLYRYQDATLKIRQTTPPQFELNHRNKSLLFLPSSFGGALKLNNSTLAFTIFQIDRFNVSSLGYVDYPPADRLTAKLELDSTSYLMGPSFNYRFSNSFSAGVSCFYHYSSAEYTFAQELPGNFASNALVVTKSNGITGVFGARAAFSPELKLGIMYGTETIHISGDNTFSYTNTQFPAANIVTEKDGDVRLPHRTAFGIAFDRPKTFTVSLDVIYYFRMEYSAPYEIAATENFANNKHKERSHFDFSLGSELYMTESFALRAGLYTNSSGATMQNGQSKVNHYGGTLGGAINTGEVTTSLGFNVMYGESGYTRNHPSTLADPASSWKRLFISLVVGSTAKI